MSQLNKNHLNNEYLSSEEEWKPVVGYEGWYEVSNYGEIKRVKPGKAIKVVGKILKATLRRDGYLCVGLCKNGLRKIIPIHRLVAIAFIPNILNKPEVNHKNGIKNDNRINNLEWVTGDENNLHSRMVLGNNRIGENNSKAKLKERDVLEIRRLLKEGNLKQVEIAKMYCVTKGLITTIKGGRVWKHVT